MFSTINKRQFGSEFEAFASQQLKLLGCKIIETNYLCKVGEIDIIARDKDNLVFVEVRYRKQKTYGGAVASVDLKKQKKLIKAASFYLQNNNLTNKVSCRFDVFAVEGSLDKPTYNWIKAAFDA